MNGSVGDIKKYIEDKNTSESVTITPEQIAKLRKDSTISQEAQSSLTDAQKVIEQNPDKLQSFIEKMKQINPILGAILETFF